MAPMPVHRGQLQPCAHQQSVLVRGVLRQVVNYLVPLLLVGVVDVQQAQNLVHRLHAPAEQRQVVVRVLALAVLRTLRLGQVVCAVHREGQAVHHATPTPQPGVVVVRHAQQGVHQRAKHRSVPRVSEVRPENLGRPRQVPQLTARRSHIAVLAGVADFVRAKVPARPTPKHASLHQLTCQRAALVLIGRRDGSTNRVHVLFQQAQERDKLFGVVGSPERPCSDLHVHVEVVVGPHTLAIPARRERRQ